MAKVEDRETASKASLNDDIGEDMRLRMYRMQVEIREAEQRAFDLFLQNWSKARAISRSARKRCHRLRRRDEARRPVVLHLSRPCHTLARGVPIEKVSAS